MYASAIVLLSYLSPGGFVAYARQAQLTPGDVRSSQYLTWSRHLSKPHEPVRMPYPIKLALSQAHKHVVVSAHNITRHRAPLALACADRVDFSALPACQTPNTTKHVSAHSTPFLLSCTGLRTVLLLAQR